MAPKKKLDGAYYARLALDYFDHPKIGVLSDAAIVAHLEMIVYSRRYLTDGEIPNRVANRVGFEVLTELASNDPDNPSIVINDDGSVTLHGYADAQETKEEVKGRQQVNARNGAKGGRPKNPVAKRTETQSVSETKPICQAEEEEEGEEEIPLTSEVATAPPRPEIEALCTLLADLIEQNGSKRPTIGKAWRDATRLMLDRDQRTPEQIAYLIRWSQADEFWRSNIQSMPKLRDKFDQLRLKAQQPDRTQRRGVGLQSSMEGLAFFQPQENQ